MTVSNAFWKSTKQANTLPSLELQYVSIIHLFPLHKGDMKICSPECPREIWLFRGWTNFHISATSFSGGRSRSTGREPPTMDLRFCIIDGEILKRHCKAVFSHCKPPALPTELKEISTNTVSRGGYEPTTVPITLGRGVFPLHIQTSLTDHVPQKNIL
jgi:hypothetical protein